jgi:cation diffusion facilitator family transporter
LSGLKIFIGIIGKSHGLVADGFHSLSDLFSDIIVYFGIIFGNKPDDSSHNYGHKKIENLAEIILGIIIISSSIFIGYKSGIAIYLHKEIQPKFITIIIAIISIISKEILFHITLKIGKKEKNSLVIANAWHHRSDSFSSIAVLIGLILSYFFKPLHIIDAYLGVMVSFILLKVGYDITFNSTKMLIDTAPTSEIQQQINKIIQNENEILDYHKVRMRYIGNQIFIEMHIMVKSDYSVKRAHDISKKLKKNIIHEIVDIYDITIHIEPYEN